MGEHYRRGQTEAEGYCGKCKRITLHRVDFPSAGQKGGGRLGPCMDARHPVSALSKEQERRRKKAERTEVVWLNEAAWKGSRRGLFQ